MSKKAEALRTKIDALTKSLEGLREALATLEKQEAQAVALANVAVGSKVRFTYGRKDNRTTREGEVIARYAEGEVTKVKVLSGAGAQARLFDLNVGDLDGLVSELVDPARLVSHNIVGGLLGLPADAGLAGIQ